MRVPSLCDNGPLRARLQMQNNVSCDFESGFSTVRSVCPYPVHFLRSSASQHSRLATSGPACCFPLYNQQHDRYICRN